MRMNDGHDSFIPGWLCNWKKSHSEWLVDTNGMRSEFELYTTAQDFCHEAAGPRMLVGREKLICVDSGPAGVQSHYAHVSSRWPLPMKSKTGVVRAGVIGRVPLEVGDDVAAHPPAQATLAVEFGDPSWTDALLFRLNGEELTDSQFVPASEDRTHCRLEYAVNVPPLREGRNFVEVAARNGIALPESILTVTAMQLRVGWEV